MLHRLPPSVQGAIARTFLRLPEGLFSLALRGGLTVDGQTLAPRARAIVALAGVGGRPELNELPLDAARREFALQVRMLGPRPRTLHEIEERVVPRGGAADLGAPPLRLRLYRPRAGVLPALVYLHGGGWVVGDLDSYDPLCRELAARTGCLVVSVDYRRAPEHRWPAAADDALAAFRFVAASAASLGADDARLAVGGDSAGGNLAAVTAQRLRDGGERPPRLQLLVYPALDLRCLTASHRSLGGQRIILSRPLIDWYRSQYWRTEADAVDPGLSPGLCPDLTGLPPAFVLTAGFDPLRDEGRDYAQRLEAAGVSTRYRCYERMFHGFVSLGGVLPEAGQALDECAEALRTAWA